MEAHLSHGELTVMYEPGTSGADQNHSGQISFRTMEPREEIATESAKDAPISEAVPRSRWNRQVALIGILIALVAAAVVLPPLINVGRYQRQITALMSRSLGRQVRLSSVELRLLPRPGFVLHDLSVSEDPGFGAEPVLSARTVVASIRMLSLWRGRMEIDRISVDEASLNLVRAADGRWNLNSLLLGAQPALTGSALPGEQGRVATAARASSHFPYLEATDSRINLKQGLEKSPYSLVSTDFSLWQETPGEWRVRLRGQPVRTDLEMSMAETGEVRMEASLRRAAQLREMPLQMQIEWRDAQLGQLSRLLSGSDAGWRGDVRADIEMQGTVDSVQTKARLRAVGVRRQEFAPETPLDFDANCNFRYQHSQNAVHDLGCETAIGDGRIHLKAELPGNAGTPEATLEVQQVPVQAALDLLRTVRGGFAPGISVKGTANGSLTYKVVTETDQERGRGSKKAARGKVAKRFAAKEEASDGLPANLQGSLTVDGVQLNGGGLKEPMVLPRITWSPVFVSGLAGGSVENTGLSGRFTVELAPAASESLVSPSSAQSVTVRLGVGARGYDAVVSGSAAPGRVRDLAYAFGLPHLDAADSFTGGTADFELKARGAWIPSADLNAPSQLTPALANSERKSGQAIEPAGVQVLAADAPGAPQAQESFSGSIELHHAQWKADFLAYPVEFTQATATISGGNATFASDFSFGGSKDGGKEATKAPVRDSAIRGSVMVNAATNCQGNDCVPQVQLRFGTLDAAAVQAALLGAPEQKSLFSPLIARMRSSDRPKWPEMAVKVQAESLVLGPATLQKPVVQVRLRGNNAVVEDWQADLFGGSAKGTGHLQWTSGQPEYTLEGSFTRINAALVGAVLNAKWAGGPLSGSGSVRLAGLTPGELGASAAGDLRFDWLRGVISAAGETKDVPPRQVRFDDWSGTVAIQGGKAQVGENAMLSAGRSSNVAGSIPFGGPVVLAVTPSESKLVAHAGASAALPTVK